MQRLLHEGCAPHEDIRGRRGATSDYDYARVIFDGESEKKVELVIDEISKISFEMTKLLRDKSYIDEILSQGNQRALEIASKNIKSIKEIIGFSRS